MSLSPIAYLQKKIYSNIFILFFVFLVPSLSKAEKSDRFQPINVEANQAIYDDLKQIYQLKGNVILTKGSIKIKTAQADVLVTPQGYQKAAATGGDNGLAFLRQKREGLNEFFEAYAQKIDYDSESDIIVLTGAVNLMRLSDKGKTLDQINADQIVYNGRNETYQAIGSGQTRVRAVISPKVEQMKAATATPNSSIILTNSNPNSNSNSNPNSNLNLEENPNAIMNLQTKAISKKSPTSEVKKTLNPPQK